ncbi:MAG: hypothetical protein JO174_07600 [Herbaspirillum sp.]|nr:hypothetical protein [Herbaspirillum sp.]
MPYLLKKWVDLPCPVLLMEDAFCEPLEYVLYQCLIVVARRLRCEGLVRLLEAIPDDNDDFRCP